MEERRDLIVEERFCGPPGVGNGGYVAGLLAGRLADRAEVVLRRPTPLATPLRLREGDEAWELVVEATGEPVATGRPGRPVLSLLDPPAAPSFERAGEVAAGAPPHPFPRCFVCGPQRGEGDGLRVTAGALAPGRFEQVAATWIPDASLCGEGREVRAPFVWAALDCPGATAALDDHRQPVLLARMRGELFGPVFVGERCVVLGWRIARDGRKHTTGTALYGEDGRLCGASEQLWIEPRPGGPHSSRAN